MAVSPDDLMIYAPSVEAYAAMILYRTQVGRWVTAVAVAAAPKTKPERFSAYSSVKGVVACRAGRGNVE